VHSELLLVTVVVVALAFDFTNGFHDTANVVASAISTRAMSPRVVIGLTAVLNFAGAFLSLKVAATVGKGIVETGKVSEMVAFGGLLGAIAWNLLTWYYGLPSSSSHALIGGVIGSMIAAVGSGAVKWHGLLVKVVIPALLSPAVAFVLAAAAIVTIYRVFGTRRPGPTNRGFRGSQWVTSAALALAHGTNDAQKTMGVIGVTLLAHNGQSAAHFHVPVWVILAAATAMGLGTYAGGWRIIRTVGMRIIKMDPAQGATAQTAGAAVILVSSHFGYPLSTTHVISGGVMGAGAGKRLSAVRWGVAGNIVVAWVLTLPLAGALGALAYWFARLFGTGVAGPLVIVGLMVATLAAMVVLRRPLVPTAS
jgi:PiT family inorganic phosphate transporter